jgi:hypothetical protein
MLKPLPVLKPPAIAALIVALSMSWAVDCARADEVELRREIELLKLRLERLEARLDTAPDSETSSQAHPVAPRSSGGTGAGGAASAAAGADGKEPLTASDLDDIDAEFMGTGSSTGGGSGGGGAGNWYDRTSLGGYGEMHLNLGGNDQIDFHRWVLYIDHEFTERLRFVSEIELEHSIAGDGKNGEIELEQAYIDATFDNGWSGKGGLYLMPIGILNETHEPTTFFGTERNPIEREIIPSTWWEGGLQASKRTENGLLWDAAFHSGLAVPSTGGNAFRIRSGRQKVSEADASEWAATARARYQGITGLDVSAFLQYQSDLSPLNAEDNAALLSGGTVSYQRGGFGVRGLIAHWDIDGDSFEDAEADSQWGYYLEPSYIWNLPNTDQARLGVFGRFSHYEYAKSSQQEVDEMSAGVNFWPVDNVVLKTDYTHIEEDGEDDNDTFNFGVGYSF